MYRNTHEKSDESITETVREINYSLIGWYLQTYGMQNAFAFIEWLGIPLFSNPDNPKWSPPKSSLPEEFNAETQRKLNHLLDGYESLELKVNYNFRNKALLLQSVSHESFASNDITGDYRGLDFMGDAILNYAIVRHLFRHPVHLDADELSDLSSLLYCNSSIATVAIRNDLHKYLRYTTPELRDNINSFVAFLRRNKFKPVDDVSEQYTNTFECQTFPLNCMLNASDITLAMRNVHRFSNVFRYIFSTKRISYLKYHQ